MVFRVEDYLPFLYLQNVVNACWLELFKEKIIFFWSQLIFEVIAQNGN